MTANNPVAELDQPYSSEGGRDALEQGEGGAGEGGGLLAVDSAS